MVAVFGIFDNLRRWEAGFSATSDADSRQFMKLSGDCSGETRASGTIFGCKSFRTGGLGRLTLYTQVKRSQIWPLQMACLQRLRVSLREGKGLASGTVERLTSAECGVQNAEFIQEAVFTGAGMFGTPGTKGAGVANAFVSANIIERLY